VIESFHESRQNTAAIPILHCIRAVGLENCCERVECWNFLFLPSH